MFSPVSETCYANRDAKVAYFRNEAYPDVEAETNYCSYGLKVPLQINMIHLRFCTYKNLFIFR